MPKELKEFLFYVSRPVAVIVKAETKKQVKAVQRRLLERALDEEYVYWFNGTGVDRVLMTEDPVALMDRGRIEEY